ncbi:MAG: hypothetical protein ACOCP5_03890 [Halanaerobiaceae bacterium]
MKKYIFLFFLIFLVLFSINLQAVDIYIIIDKISIKDVIQTRTKNIDFLQENGSAGLVNVRTAEDIDSKSTYLSIGAGERASGNKNTYSGKNLNQGVVNKNIDELKKLNKDNLYNPSIGMMGDLLKEQNKVVAVTGNSDNDNIKRRPVVSIAMDRTGWIPLGDVGKDVLRKTKESPGLRTDWDQINKNILEYKNRADIIMVETGDFSRISDLEDILSDNEINNLKKSSLKEIDDFIGFILNHFDLNKNNVGLIVPTPPKKEINQGNKLSWILLTGRDFSSGWTTSLTTRRKGIITQKDILPTMVKSEKQKTGARKGNIGNNQNSISIPGNIIKTISENISWQDLINLNKKITIMSQLRSPYIKGFIILQLLVILWEIINIIYKRFFISDKFKNIFEYLMESLLLLPFNYLLISLFYFRTKPGYLILLIVVIIMELYLIHFKKFNKIEKLVIISAATLSLIIFDLIFKKGIMADSLLGYSSIIGARYYGIGNEYMGFFIGGFLVLSTGLLEIFKELGYNRFLRYKVFYFMIFSFLMILLIGMGNLGANFGGTITILGASIIALMYLLKSIDLSKIFLAIIIAVLLILILGYFDYIELFGARTHIGKFFGNMLEGNLDKFKNIIIRKGKMNLKLLKWTIWTRVLLGFILYLFIIFLYPRGRVEKFLKQNPQLSASIYGGLGASFITMLVNDSGVVAAATILFFPVFSFLYLYQEFGKK